jgi:hypothetical protein
VAWVWLICGETLDSMVGWGLEFFFLSLTAAEYKDVYIYWVGNCKSLLWF